MTRRIRLLVALEEALLRELVSTVIGRESDFEVVAEAHDGTEAVARAERHHPDVAILSTHLHGEDGPRATALIKAKVPTCHVLLLSNRDDQTMLVRSIGAGATGYATRSMGLAQLINVVRTIAAGEMWVPPKMLPGLLRTIVGDHAERQRAEPRISTLSRRERQVLASLTQGKSTRAIAEGLKISPETARTHVQNLLTKLGVHSRLQAAALARRSSLLEAEIDIEEPTGDRSALRSNDEAR